MKKEMAASFLLACAVVVGALWLVSQSDLHESKRNQNVPDTHAKAYQSRPSGSLDQASPSDLKSNANVQEERVGQGPVTKCIVNGKTIYSDEKCLTGAKADQIQLHDSAGFVSPPKAVLAELTAQRVAAEDARIKSLQQPVALPVQPKKIECDSLDKHIEWLDSMARQPQSAQMQDWIRQERTKARDRQFAIQC